MSKGSIIGSNEVGRAAPRLAVASAKRAKRRAKPSKYIVGIDEVGRGALAGPVTVAVVILAKNLRFHNLKDSKALSVVKREVWFENILKRKSIFFRLACVSPRVIDRINISNAANLAAARAFSRLKFQCGLPLNNARIYLDGGLYLKTGQIKSKISVTTLIRGDEKINAIKIASIIAKVKRDRLMVGLHHRHPQYGFDRHKGYGTKRHFEAIRLYGHSQIHRLTFIKKYFKLNSKR